MNASEGIGEIRNMREENQYSPSSCRHLQDLEP